MNDKKKDLLRTLYFLLSGTKRMKLKQVFDISDQDELISFMEEGE
jgi:hypothetical protein